MARDNGFYLFVQYKEKLKRLSNEQLGELIRILFDYKESGTEPEIDDPLIGMGFDSIRIDIDKQAEEYEAKRSAGKKGGDTTTERKQAQADSSTSKQTQAESSTPKQSEADPSYKKEKEKERKKENKNESSACARETRFTPPTLEEIESYCRIKGLSVNPKQFYEYFTEGNWIDSKGQKVRNWKQKLLTWNGNHDRASPNRTPTKNAFTRIMTDERTTEQYREIERMIENGEI